MDSTILCCLEHQVCHGTKMDAAVHRALLGNHWQLFGKEDFCPFPLGLLWNQEPLTELISTSLALLPPQNISPALPPALVPEHLLAHSHFWYPEVQSKRQAEENWHSIHNSAAAASTELSPALDW